MEGGGLGHLGVLVLTVVWWVTWDTPLNNPCV